MLTLFIVHQSNVSSVVGTSSVLCVPSTYIKSISVNNSDMSMTKELPPENINEVTHFRAQRCANNAYRYALRNKDAGTNIIRQ